MHFNKTSKLEKKNVFKLLLFSQREREQSRTTSQFSRMIYHNCILGIDQKSINFLN